MVTECEGDGNAGVGNGGGVGVVSAGHECVGGTHSSGIESSTSDVLRDECGVWDDRSWWSV